MRPCLLVSCALQHDWSHAMSVTHGLWICRGCLLQCELAAVLRPHRHDVHFRSLPVADVLGQLARLFDLQIM